MEIPTVSACIGKIADTISRLPVKLYRKNDGKITEIQDDSRLALLNGETGDTLTTVDMWKAVIEDYFLGNGAWIYINSDGITAKSLHYVDSRNISIITNNEPIFKAFNIMVNGKKFYDFQFIRLFRKTKNGWSNIPVQYDNNKILSVAYNSLKLENKMNRNGGNKGGFFKAKSTLSREALETVKAGCRALYDTDNERIPVLNDGLDFQPVSSTAVELQMNESKKANSLEICKIFGFSHTVIDGGASDGDNKKFIETIVSILNQIETALDAFLLLETEKNQGFYFAFDTKELTRGSLRERYEAYQIAIKNHILQVDEIRREEDYEPLGFNFVTMGLGDVLLNPKTMEVFTPNTGQISKLGENRAEIELRYNHNHDEKGRFCSGEGGGRMSSSSFKKLYSNGGANPDKSIDNSEKDDIIISDDVVNHSSIGEFTAYKNPKKPEKGGGNFSKGGHGQENINELERRGIEYNIVRTYENGVRVGNVPKHSEKGKRSGIGQSWFPKSWTKEDIRQAGADVLKKKQVVFESKDSNGNIITYTVFGKHRGVTVGVYTDENGSLNGKKGTIFPDNLQRKISDFNVGQK